MCFKVTLKHRTMPHLKAELIYCMCYMFLPKMPNKVARSCNGVRGISQYLHVHHVRTFQASYFIQLYKSILSLEENLLLNEKQISPVCKSDTVHD